MSLLSVILATYSGMQFLGHLIIIFLILGGTLYLVAAVSFYISIKTTKEFQFLYTLVYLLFFVIYLFNNRNPHGCDMIPHCGFNFHFPKKLKLQMFIYLFIFILRIEHRSLFRLTRHSVTDFHPQLLKNLFMPLLGTCIFWGGREYLFKGFAHFYSFVLLLMMIGLRTFLF
jgi:hypothetical protein